MWENGKLSVVLIANQLMLLIHNLWTLSNGLLSIWLFLFRKQSLTFHRCNCDLWTKNPLLTHCRSAEFLSRLAENGPPNIGCVSESFPCIGCHIGKKQTKKVDVRITWERGDDKINVFATSSRSDWDTYIPTYLLRSYRRHSPEEKRPKMYLLTIKAIENWYFDISGGSWRYLAICSVEEVRPKIWQRFTLNECSYWYQSFQRGYFSWLRHCALKLRWH